MNHAKYGPSSMARIMACPGSVKLQEQSPPQPGSPYAEEGTQAHALAEAILLQEPEANWPEHSAEMLEAVRVYVDFMDPILDAARHYGIELKAFGDEELFGTPDCWAQVERTLYVADYKHGAGVMVSPVENRQAMTYAGLILEDPQLPVSYDDIDTVVLVIAQPRAPHGDPVQDWETTPRAISEHMRAVDAAINTAKLPNPPTAMGAHCRFCTAKLICPAIKAAEQGIVAKSPEDMEPREIAEMLDASKVMEAKIKDLRAYAQYRMEKGETVPDWKLVNKQGRKRWVDTEALHRWARRQGVIGKLFPKQPLSPAKALKELPDKDLSALIETPITGTTIAPQSDRRKAIEPTAATLAALGQRFAS